MLLCDPPPPTDVVLRPLLAPGVPLDTTHQRPPSDTFDCQSPIQSPSRSLMTPW